MSSENRTHSSATEPTSRWGRTAKAASIVRTDKERTLRQGGGPRQAAINASLRDRPYRRPDARCRSHKHPSTIVPEPPRRAAGARPTQQGVKMPRTSIHLAILESILTHQDEIVTASFTQPLFYFGKAPTPMRTHSLPQASPPAGATCLLRGGVIQKIGGPGRTRTCNQTVMSGV